MMQFWSRRSLIGTAGAAALCAIPVLGRAASVERDVTFAQDFDELWNTLGERYCYFPDKRTDWNKVRSLYRPMAIAAPDEAAFEEVVRLVLAELYDAHTHLNDPPDGSPRWPLYDLLGEGSADNVKIVAVADDSAARRAGLAPGLRITAIEGRPIGDCVRALMPRCLTRPDPAAEAYAINVALAGRRGKPRLLTVRDADGHSREVGLPLGSSPSRPDLEHARLPDGTGHIVIRSFADTDMVAAFDTALDDLRDAPGLILDMRDNGGGNTAVARPMMGRFITRAMPYATMRRREGAKLGASWTEWVEPRGPFTYDRPVVVLTSHWSASMAEGFPMGMRAIGRATIVGTRMMGLGAAVFPITLDRTGIRAQYSAEPVYDIHGQPRDALVPDIVVPEGQDILAAGSKALASAIHR
ncbi:MAG TPA: S41 family peptidase [Novosphingobium sp.]|nr:S41 family peptidase [Novosphingobium sp.]